MMMHLPRLVYHLAEASNWPSIQQHGLLPATALMQLAGLADGARDALETSQRTAYTRLSDAIHIRDQKPMPAAALQRCLVALSPAEWFQLINQRVFFWCDADRMNRQRHACEPRPQVVMTIDSARFVGAYADAIALTPINTGNARRAPATRGTATFVPLQRWRQDGWASEAAALGTTPRSKSHAPVELTVARAIPDIEQYIVSTTPLAPGAAYMPERESG